MLILILKKEKVPMNFSKNMYKLLNNCIYGKSIENQRKRMNVKLVNDKKSVSEMCKQTKFYITKNI